MMEKKTASISIIKQYFGKKSTIVSLIFVSVLSLTGILSVFTNLKSGLCAAGALTLVCLFQKISGNRYLLWAVAVIFAVAYWLGQMLLDIEFAFFAVTSLFLSFIFFIKPCYGEYKKASDFEVFYFDKRKLRCLVTMADSDYKGYMFDPKNYLKEFSSSSVKAVSFTGKSMTIAVGDLLVRPKELSPDDLHLIRDYVQQYFPDLLQNTGVMDENRRKENRFYLNKLIIFSPVPVLGVVIVFFADNGRNLPLTCACLALMVLFPIIIHNILRKIKE